MNNLFNIVKKGDKKMIVKCFMKECKFNKEDICTKEEIEIFKITTYEEDSPECMDYEES